MTEFNSRVFLDNTGQPKMATVIDGDVWIFYLHRDKNRWVTQQKISWDLVHLLIDNLSQEEQLLYPPIYGDNQLDQLNGVE